MGTSAVVTENDLLRDFVEAIERARGRINQPLEGRGRSSVKPLAALGNRRIAMWETRNIFQVGQTIAPLADETALTLKGVNGQTSPFFSVYDLNANADAGANVFQVRPYNDLAAKPGTHFAAREASDNAIYVWSGAGIDAGGVCGIRSSAGASVTFTLPPISGVGLVRAGTADREGISANIGATTLVSSANTQKGVYIVTAYILATVVGAGIISANAIYRDQNNAADITLPIASKDMSNATPQRGSFAIQCRLGSTAPATGIRYSVTGYSSGTYSVYFRVNAT